MSVPPMVIREPTTVALYGLNVSFEHSAAEMAPPMGIVQPTLSRRMRISHPTSAHWMTIHQPMSGPRISIGGTMSVPPMVIREPTFVAFR